MRRCPSFSQRPGFPSGLRVLVLEAAQAAAAHAVTELEACGYTTTCCSTADKALQQLQAQPHGAPFDLLLADSRCLAASPSLQAAAKPLPLVLMSDQSDGGENMASWIRRGAQDFLQKPLHRHRLRNIWQHVVRRMMQSEASSKPANQQRRRLHQASRSTGACAGAAAGGTPSGQEDSSGGGCGGDSGSNVSSSEQAHLKQDEANGPAMNPFLDMDLGLNADTALLLDEVDAALGNPLAGLADSFFGLLSTDLAECSDAPQALGEAPAAPQASCQPPARHQGRPQSHSGQMPGMVSSGQQQHVSGGPVPVSVEQLPQQPQAPGTDTSVPCSRVVGHPAGQLPALKALGMAWGLPVTPIQFAPRTFGPSPLGMMVPPAMPPMTPALMMANAMMTPFLSSPVAAHSAAVRDMSAFGPAASSKAAAVPAELLAALSRDKPPASSIGLKLELSPSLIDLISKSLH